MWQIVFYFLVFIAWSTMLSVVLLTAAAWRLELVGLGVALLLAGWITWGYLLRPDATGDRRRLLRLRPLSAEALRWTLAAAVVLLLLFWAVGEVYVRLIPVPPENFNPFGSLMGTPAGRLSITVLAVTIAPIMEELFFRGLIQRSLERRWGVTAGITATAALFALIHLLPWVLPLYFLLGLAFGYVVYATRSIWAGVILHAANNSVAIVSMGLGDAPTPTPTIWQAGPDADLWIALAVLLIAAWAATRVAQRLWEVGHGRPWPLAPTEGR